MTGRRHHNLSMMLGQGEEDGAAEDSREAAGPA